MTRKPGAISGRSLDPKRTRRNHDKASIITGDRLLPPLTEDAQGRIAVKPMARIEATDGTLADTSEKLDLVLSYLKDAGYMIR